MTLIGSDHLPKLEEGTVTVTTSGTPVQVTAIKGKKLYIQAVESNDDKRIMVGDSSVDGATTPPVCRRVLYATQSEIFREKDVSTIYVDSDQNGAKAHYAVFG